MNSNKTDKIEFPKPNEKPPIENPNNNPKPEEQPKEPPTEIPPERKLSNSLFMKLKNRILEDLNFVLFKL